MLSPTFPRFWLRYGDTRLHPATRFIRLIDESTSRPELWHEVVDLSFSRRCARRRASPRNQLYLRSNIHASGIKGDRQENKQEKTLHCGTFSTISPVGVLWDVDLWTCGSVLRQEEGRRPAARFSTQLACCKTGAISASCTSREDLLLLFLSPGETILLPENNLRNRRQDFRYMAWASTTLSYVVTPNLDEKLSVLDGNAHALDESKTKL